jgi:hypothetical protein
MKAQRSPKSATCLADKVMAIVWPAFWYSNVVGVMEYDGCKYLSGQNSLAIFAMSFKTEHYYFSHTLDRLNSNSGSGYSIGPLTIKNMPQEKWRLF